MSKIVETYTPLKPMSLGDEPITKLEFREITGADMMALPIGAAPTTGDFIAIAVKITNQPPTVFAKASGQDVLNIALIVDRLLVNGAPATGDE